MVPLLHVDAFTDVAFRGNPAAVCLLDGSTDDIRWMQDVAAEMNLPETAFVMPRRDGDLDLRWFTPTVEVDLCGHATLAAAHGCGRRNDSLTATRRGSTPAADCCWRSRKTA